MANNGTRSQAEELLAAERARAAEKERLRFEGDLDKWMKIIGAGISGYQPEAYTLMDFACEELVRLRADNAAQAARIKALETELENGGRVKGVNTQYANALAYLEMTEDDDPEEFAKRIWDEREALENRLAAAEKALEPFAEIAGEPWADENGWTDAACQNDRIVDWFGPSAFQAARAVLGGKPS